MGYNVYSNLFLKFSIKLYSAEEKFNEIYETDFSSPGSRPKLSSVVKHLYNTKKCTTL
jgi:hypothetical protein